jgi:hypothetical protein
MSVPGTALRDRIRFWSLELDHFARSVVVVRVMMVMKLCKRCSHQCATIIAKTVDDLQTLNLF